jgi:glycosyltransferase involved in cell wall biosynthesis
MAKVDLHVHSKYSEHPSEWFLQRIGASESYTDPDFIYKTAMESGMTYVTLTDHNCIKGSLLLKEKYPENTFTGVESTAYFPEDGCKVHVLIYGLTEKDFDEVQRLRTDIYQLRDFIRERGLAHSVAHATYAVNKRLTVDHLEKLILLFDAFEGINGSRSRMNNSTWMHVLKNLGPSHIHSLYLKHRIAPFSEEPWIKGFTAGSDDHGGIFIGKTYAEAEAGSPEEFLSRIRSKESTPAGRHNNFQGLAFSIYKVAYDFSLGKSSRLTGSLLSRITENVLGENRPSLRDRIRSKKLRFSSRLKKNDVRMALAELIDGLSLTPPVTIDEKIDFVYDKIGDIVDSFFQGLLRTLEEDLKKGNFESIVRNVSSSMSGIFLSLPFFTTLRHLYEGRGIIDSLVKRFGCEPHGGRKRILWFTDTIGDLNGVSSTLSNIGWFTYVNEKDLMVVTSLSPQENKSPLPPNIMNLPSIYSFSLPYYEEYKLKIPSLLQSIKEIHQFEPTEICISTPGTMGLLGLLAARLLNVPCSGVFHTDFTLQAAEILDDDGIVQTIEDCMRWFYFQMDEIMVPSEEYVRILEERGYDRSRMRIMHRGIDTGRFRPCRTGHGVLWERFGVKDGKRLLYVGRISKDKNLIFLLKLFQRLREKRQDVRLVFVGDGPLFPDLRKKVRDIESVTFTGRLDRDALPEIYSDADVLVFPSNTDTFGMAVLEAQACGLPAVVSNRGGPQGLVSDGRTGLVAEANNMADWEEKVELILSMMDAQPDLYASLRTEARENALRLSSWERFLSDLFDSSPDDEENGEEVLNFGSRSCGRPDMS